MGDEDLNDHGEPACSICSDTNTQSRVAASHNSPAYAWPCSQRGWLC